MSIRSFVFINRADKSKTIRIPDEQSARALWQTLEANGPGQWEVFEETLPTTAPIPVEAAAPAKAERTVDRRKHPRINAEFRVVIVNGQKSFRSFSEDISMGGALLKHRLPAEVANRICDLYIGNANSSENIQIRCRIAVDSRTPSRVIFEPFDVSAMKKLEQWIMEVQARGLTEEAAAA